MFASAAPDQIDPLKPLRPINRRRVDVIKQSVLDLNCFLQPALACKDGDRFKLFAGFHRYEVAKALQMPLPLHVFPAGLPIERMVAMAMAENNARSAMNFLERADAMLLVQRETGLTLTASGAMCCMSPAEVSEVKQAKEHLDDSVAIALANANIGYGTAYELSKLPKARQLALRDDVLNGMTREQLKHLVRKPRKTSIKIDTPSSYEELVARLSEQLSKVKALEKQGVPFNVVFKALI